MKKKVEYELQTKDRYFFRSVGYKRLWSIKGRPSKNLNKIRKLKAEFKNACKKTELRIIKRTITEEVI